MLLNRRLASDAPFGEPTSKLGQLATSGFLPLFNFVGFSDAPSKENFVAMPLCRGTASDAPQGEPIWQTFPKQLYSSKAARDFRFCRCVSSIVTFLCSGGDVLLTHQAAKNMYLHVPRLIP